ncbi:MAG: DUF2934 domain-containing protein [Terriglobia bacterium]|nr:DUF2934 domain-containing protein [Terriglobia bacterium]
MSNSHPKASGKHSADGKKYVKMSSALRRPTEDDVRTLAYQIFEVNGRQEDHADQDWFQAEQELLGRSRSGEL